MTNQNLTTYGAKTLTERSQPLNLSHDLLETMRTHLIRTKDQLVLGQMYIRVYYVDTRLGSEIVTIDSQVFDRHFMADLSLPAIQVKVRKTQSAYFLTDLMGDGNRYVWLFDYTFALGQAFLSPDSNLFPLLRSLNEK